MRSFLLVIFFSLFLGKAWAQTATVFGNVRDEAGQPLPSSSIRLTPGAKGFVSDEKGEFRFEIPANREVSVTFSRVGYEEFIRKLTLQPGQQIPLYVVLIAQPYVIDSVVIEDRDVRDQPSMVKIDPKKFEALPSASGGIEAILKVFGAQSSNELSSQYSVRGGNYDENLVYVNDFEIFRPFLIRASQQEGLSFVNPDLTGSLAFSAGGFQPVYGDKMSSVLDITYKKPTKFGGSAALSLLGASLSLEGASGDQRWRYLFGARYKTTQYLLNSLETTGEYQPNFTDVQADIQFDVSEKVTLEALANYSGNVFQFIPEERVTTFGTIQTTLQLTVFYDGQEVDQYQSGMGGLSLNYRPKKNLNLKFLSSIYRDVEQETYDVTGQYFLGEVNNNFGSEDFGQTLYYLGVGTTQEFGRDFLDATIYKLAHKGSLLEGNHFFQWGADYNREIINDELSEWERVDSAGFTLPYSTEQINLQNIIRSTYDFASNRYMGYVQDSWTLNADRNFLITYGVRFNYWDLNKQLLISPRGQVSFQPNWLRDVVFRGAIGAYDQPPFYRELRDLDGVVHTDVKAQRSIHYVAGADYNFEWWGRPFKLVTELYYKQLFDLNPYELDNVRIRYFAENDAKGYATGVDFRLNGEFVRGAESWIALSFLQTKENLADDFLWEVDTVFVDDEQTEYTLDSTQFFPGFIPRPTDQFINFAMFFQDYLPGNENFKVHLSLIFGSGLPTGPPDHIRARDTLRLSPYRRVDIGFSALLVDGNRTKMQESKLWRHFDKIWLSLEIFNLLDVSNEISYSWIKDLNNVVYAVPNYLTGRRVNLRLEVRF
jgi:hypothetical protein